MLSHEELLTILKEELDRWGKNYVFMIQSIEDLFFMKPANYLTLAAHNMRDIVNLFLNQNANNKLVKKQKWFVPDKKIRKVE